jgi:mRNA interferase MazF
MGMEVKRFDVWLVALDPVGVKEIRKTRPCLIISTDESNQFLNTVIIAPLTSVIRGYPTRVKCSFQKVKGEIAVDQLRAADKERLIKKLGILDDTICGVVCDRLTVMFEY